MCCAVLCCDMQALSSVTTADMNEGFEYAVSHIIDPANVDHHVYSVNWSIALSQDRYLYSLDAEFTVCRSTADRTLLTLNAAMADGTYSSILSAFAGSEFNITGHFSFDQIVPVDRQLVSLAIKDRLSEGEL